MNKIFVVASACAVWGAGLPQQALAQTAPSPQSRPPMERADRIDLGKREFEARCASCHGADAKGLGPVRPYLTQQPTDLTQAARRNGGVFPMDRYYQIIDGTEALPAHGTRDMPVWGREYRVQAAEYYMDTQYNEAAYVRARILMLLEYVNRLQVR